MLLYIRLSPNILSFSTQHLISLFVSRSHLMLSHYIKLLLFIEQNEMKTSVIRKLKANEFHMKSHHIHPNANIPWSDKWFTLYSPSALTFLFFHTIACVRLTFLNEFLNHQHNFINTSDENDPLNRITACLQIHPKMNQVKSTEHSFQLQQMYALCNLAYVRHTTLYVLCTLYTTHLELNLISSNILNSKFKRKIIWYFQTRNVDWMQWKSQCKAMHFTWIWLW